MKIVLTLVSLLVLVVLYGIVNWKVFERETLLSNPIDCMPTFSPEDETGPIYKPQVDREKSLREKLFGERCVTY